MGKPGNPAVKPWVLGKKTYGKRWRLTGHVYGTQIHISAEIQDSYWWHLGYPPGNFEKKSQGRKQKIHRCNRATQRHNNPVVTAFGKAHVDP
jgi:hypothetical protein